MFKKIAICQSFFFLPYCFLWLTQDYYDLCIAAMDSPGGPLSGRTTSEPGFEARGTTYSMTCSTSVTHNFMRMRCAYRTMS